jgi:hypothetical protein
MAFLLKRLAYVIAITRYGAGGRGLGRGDHTSQPVRGSQLVKRLTNSLYRTHLTSFAGVLGFEVSRYFAINDRACLTRLFFARTGIKPASCKAFSFRNRSQMGLYIGLVKVIAKRCCKQIA